MTSAERIYLDNAATSWPKPEVVYQAVDQYMRHLGAPAGRSVYREAVEVERLVDQARQRLAQLIGAEDARRVVFTSNGTDSLNLALHGVLGPGDHVVTTDCEHNSVLRPLRQLEECRDVRVTRVPCDGIGVVEPSAIANAIEPNTRLIAITHASNVTGALQPVEAVGKLVAESNALLLIDAAQSLGHVPASVSSIGAHLLAAPGHKGLLGPLGTGVLYISPEAEHVLASTRQGGTGTVSETDKQPDTLPDKFEAGNHNVPGIIGLGAALGYLQERGLGAVREHEQDLTQRLLDGLCSMSSVTVYGPRNATTQLGVVSISIDGYDPQEAASILDSAYSIQVRSGLHCAPRMHQSLGTLASGGTIRLSIGVFNTAHQIDTAIEAIGEFAASH